jgi:peptide chain release factor 1
VEPLVVQIEDAYAEVERGLSDPAAQNDQAKLRELGRRHKRLSEAHALARRWRELNDSLEEARTMLAAGETDPEMRAYLESEVATAEEALPPLEEELRAAMLEPDPDDGRDVIVEIRAGAGGDEAARSPATSTTCSRATPGCTASRPRRSTRRRRMPAASSRSPSRCAGKAPTRC